MGKRKKHKVNFQSLYHSTKQEKSRQDISFKNLKPLVTHNETRQVFDSWINEVASVGANNALTQHNKFILQRFNYHELASMANDTFINNAISIISYDMLSHGYKINISCENLESEHINKIKEELENKIIKFDLNSILENLIKNSLIYGGAFLFININEDGKCDGLEIPINLSSEYTKDRDLKNFIVVTPDVCSAKEVNTNNPLEKDYMKPSEWHISGYGGVSSTRLHDLSFFSIANTIKPLFNYLGISLTQLMQPYTSNAETVREAIAELMLRFRTDYITTSSENISNEEYLARIKFNNFSKNNLSTLLLSENETLNQVTTSLSGFDNIISQAYELVVASSRIPATRLMGMSPRGFNATGESDLKHFYELIKQFQAVLKPILIYCLQVILKFEMKQFENLTLDIEFNSLGHLSEKEKVEISNLKSDYFLKLQDNQVITDNEVIECIKNNDLELNSIDLKNEKRIDNSLKDFNFNDFNLDKAI